MASIKNFGIAGVSSDVQLGKSGGRLVYDSGNTVFKFTGSDGSTPVNIRVASTPVNAADAASKGYVDANSEGLDVKASVRAASTANVTIAGPGAAIDGVTLASGDRVLLKDQTAGATNGIYIWNGAAAAMTRAGDMDATSEITGGAFTFVEEGTVNADSGWVISTDGAITLGTTAHAWTQFSGAGMITAGDGLVKSGNTLEE